MADRPHLKSPLDEPPPPAEEPAPPPEPTPRGFRFGIAWLMGLTFLVAFAAAGYGAMTKGGKHHAYYVMFALLAPFLALGLASILQAAKRRQAKRKPRVEEDPWA